MEPYAATREQYVEFAGQVAGASPCLADWAGSLAGDEAVLTRLSDLPALKQQPNLVFAAARWHGVPAPGPYAALRDALLGDDGTIRATVLARSTQTNEVGRLATLTPAFAALAGDRPVALLEVGASAGLCLYPDRYRYRWETTNGSFETTTPLDAPVLTCRVTGAAPLPDRPPEVAWRGGIDLNPLDVNDEDAMAWLTTLVWPEQDDRRERLSRAVSIARADPPRLVRGDLLTALPALVEEAAAHAPVVVFHSAVIAYLEPADRVRFQQLMTGLVVDGACHWVGNEGAGVLPDVTATARVVPEGIDAFVLGMDGQAVARTHGHGQSMTWF